MNCGCWPLGIIIFFGHETHFVPVILTLVQTGIYNAVILRRILHKRRSIIVVCKYFFLKTSVARQEITEIFGAKIILVINCEKAKARTIGSEQHNSHPHHGAEHGSYMSSDGDSGPDTCARMGHAA